MAKFSMLIIINLIEDVCLRDNQVNVIEGILQRDLVFYKLNLNKVKFFL
jgi:hypothetical protein